MKICYYSVLYGINIPYSDCSNGYDFEFSQVTRQFTMALNGVSLVLFKCSLLLYLAMTHSLPYSVVFCSSHESLKRTVRVRSLYLSVSCMFRGDELTRMSSEHGTENTVIVLNDAIEIFSSGLAYTNGITWMPIGF